MNEGTPDLTCAAADELAAAYGLGAVDSSEERSISGHLAACPRPHDEAHRLIDAAAAMSESLEPVTPPAFLRERLMATITATPQDHRVSGRGVASSGSPRHHWWQMRALPAAIAAVAIAAAVGLGTWGVTINGQLADRDAALQIVASAESVHAVSGSAGVGWLVERPGATIFLAENLAAIPVDRLYELWLIEDGVPTAVGTFTDTEGVVVVPLERALGSATTFAVTLESGRVEQPTTDPVLVGDLDL